MTYIIDDRLIFRAEDGALWLKDRYAEKIILTPIVARLLHFFLQEQGKVLSRETILYRVWEDYGLEPSNNSLNQYVSQIRKILFESGLPDNVIRTIPRFGFSFSSELLVVTESNEATKSDHIVYKNDGLLVGKKHDFTIQIYTVIFIILFVITPFLTEILTSKIQREEMKVTPVQIGKVDHCIVYSLLMGRNSILPDTFLLAQHFIKEKGINCRKDNDVYFFASNGMITQQSGRVFISSCHKSAGEIISCTDNSEYTWLSDD